MAMQLISLLEAGRRDLLDAVAGIPPERILQKPPQGWSVLECVEHVVLAENRFLGWVENSTEVAPKPDNDRELQVFHMVRSRLTRREAPEALLPGGRFAHPEEALAAFQAVRDRAVQLVRERGEGLYALSVTHPRFGIMNGVELMHLIDGHARRHAEQIREMGEADA